MLFEIMGNEIDLYMEFRNQKEALARKESILKEISNLLKSIQDLDEEDERYQKASKKLENLQDELDRINQGMIKNY